MDEKKGLDYLTIGDLAIYLKLPVETVYKYARTGKIPASKVGRHWRFERSFVDEWITKNMHTHATSMASQPKPAVIMKPEDPVEKKSVLVVDDEPAVRDLLYVWLSEMNCNPLTAANGTLALELLQKNPIELVLLDLLMPSLDGVETLRQIRSLLPSTRVVIITAYFESNLMDKALELGPLTILKKPVLRNVLQDLIKNIYSDVSSVA